MKGLLKKLSLKILETENNKVEYNKFIQLREQDGWKTLESYLMYVRAFMVEDMLTKRFSELKPMEKDVNQRAYAMVNDLIIFLLDPLAEARKLAKYKNQNFRERPTGK
jgi:hypothetical protein